MDDFRESLARVQPSAKREGFATVPDVTWDDVGALQDIREELTMAILVGLAHSSVMFRNLLDHYMRLKKQKHDKTLVLVFIYLFF